MARQAGRNVLDELEEIRDPKKWCARVDQLMEEARERERYSPGKKPVNMDLPSVFQNKVRFQVRAGYADEFARVAETARRRDSALVFKTAGLSPKLMPLFEVLTRCKISGIECKKRTAEASERTLGCSVDITLPRKRVHHLDGELQDEIFSPVIYEAHKVADTDELIKEATKPRLLGPHIVSSGFLPRMKPEEKESARASLKKFLEKPTREI